MSNEVLSHCLLKPTAIKKELKDVSSISENVKLKKNVYYNGSLSYIVGSTNGLL